jgi:shikimate kinase
MKRYIVTLGREFGCNAREIGRQVASRMGVKFYDRELVDRAASRVGVNSDYFADSDEHDKVKDSFYAEFGYGLTTSFYSEKAIEAQAWVIREIANSESCVLLGRCADYFLSEFGNVLSVFVYAPVEYRIHHISESYNLDYRNAEKMIRRIDKQRHNYYEYVAGKGRGDRHGKHLMLDVSLFGIEGTVDMIYHALSLRFSIPN